MRRSNKRDSNRRNSNNTQKNKVSQRFKQSSGLIETIVYEEFENNIKKICEGETHAIAPAAIRGRIAVTIAPYVNCEQVGLTDDYEYDLKKWRTYELHTPDIKTEKLDTKDAYFKDYDSFITLAARDDYTPQNKTAVAFPSNTQVYKRIFEYCKPALHKMINNETLVNDSDWTIIWRPHENTTTDEQIGNWHVDTFVSEPEKMAYAFTIGDSDAVATQYVNLPMLRPKDFDKRTLHEQCVIQNLAADISLRAVARDKTFIMDTKKRHHEVLNNRILKAKAQPIKVSFDIDKNNEKKFPKNLKIDSVNFGEITMATNINSSLCKITIFITSTQLKPAAIQQKIKRCLSDMQIHSSNYIFAYQNPKKRAGTWNLIESLDKHTLAEFAQTSIHYGIPNGRRHFFLLLRKIPQNNLRQTYGKAALDYVFRTKVSDYSVEQYNRDCQNILYSFKSEISDKTLPIARYYNKIVKFCDELKRKIIDKSIRILRNGFYSPPITIPKQDTEIYFISLCLSNPDIFFNTEDSASALHLINQIPRKRFPTLQNFSALQKLFFVKGSEHCREINISFRHSIKHLLQELEDYLYEKYKFYPDMRYNETSVDRGPKAKTTTRFVPQYSLSVFIRTSSYNNYDVNQIKENINSFFKKKICKIIDNRPVKKTVYTGTNFEPTTGLVQISEDWDSLRLIQRDILEEHKIYVSVIPQSEPAAAAAAREPAVDFKAFDTKDDDTNEKKKSSKSIVIDGELKETRRSRKLKHNLKIASVLGLSAAAILATKYYNKRGISMKSNGLSRRLSVLRNDEALIYSPWPMPTNIQAERLPFSKTPSPYSTI